MLAAQPTQFVTNEVTPTRGCIPVYVRRNGSLPARGQQLQGGELGVDIPGVDTMLTAGKAIFYVGIGSALIVASMFAWKVVDTFFGE